ncbi:hypothetical protein BDK51DRAFT_43266 [Blyttiomyces helicus]|uniref:Uncharacterized protein n=1 Tax=Blyttiomyces helicus TaxID=388810 RepID=A0A4P9WSE0_9FUNG|nr:hypothetical protein BDK51DRAFT_43266 [Blyttiomyces helicus]|eukprot:RKO93916.1 hypothetical protein BDK51DRAFT_43266 [Blyttiomyces helicus]
MLGLWLPEPQAPEAMHSAWKRVGERGSASKLSGSGHGCPRLQKPVTGWSGGGALPTRNTGTSDKLPEPQVSEVLQSTWTSVGSLVLGSACSSGRLRLISTSTCYLRVYRYLVKNWEAVVKRIGAATWNPCGIALCSCLLQSTEHLVNKWATIDHDAYIQTGVSTKSGAAAILEPKYYNLYVDAMGDAVDINGPAEVSRAGAVTQDEPLFGADKESKVEQEDHENLTAKPWPKTTLDENLAEAPSTSGTATPGGSATFGGYGYWNQAATKNKTKDITAAKRMAKKDKPTPMKTPTDTEAINYKLVVPGQRDSKSKTPIKKSDWAEMASAKASAKAQVKITQMKMQPDLELAQLRLRNNR